MNIASKRKHFYYVCLWYVFVSKNFRQFFKIKITILKI